MRSARPQRRATAALALVRSSDGRDCDAERGGYSAWCGGEAAPCSARAARTTVRDARTTDLSSFFSSLRVVQPSNPYMPRHLCRRSRRRSAHGGYFKVAKAPKTHAPRHTHRRSRRRSSNSSRSCSSARSTSSAFPAVLHSSFVGHTHTHTHKAPCRLSPIATVFVLSAAPSPSRRSSARRRRPFARRPVARQEWTMTVTLRW